jgi:prepilin-type N-terminal cleavage/methylation domain-containing protein
LEKYRIKIDRGFTLIEMLMALVIIAGGTSLALPHLSGMYDKAQFKADVRKVSAMFRQLRNRAITEKKIYCIQIDLDERSLNYGPYNKEQLREKGLESRYVLPESIEKMSYFADGEEYFSGNAWFTFYALGSSGGGELKFYGPKERAFSMSIKPITGAVVLNEEGDA